ncbi:Phosphoglycerate dehydrogenase [Devosia enhydra]|uniref:Phosphoglycerate dehydrogenase n=1 Tax=Devosia enhydra TaxID=665118 RepID=A0A1K2HXU9_9HYPH|nr:2-hydroxyacid dehydrogenase [Devosia enhydra]SFZ84620.1 Phosphoglycerate dehydrogenase [Devosia enhydra]
MRVLVDWDIPPEERSVLSNWPAGLEIIEGGSRLSGENKLALAPSLDVHTGLMRTATRPFLEAATQLKLVNLTGHGVDLLLRDGIPDLLTRRNIRLATADGGDIAIAEYAIMAMIMLSRQVLRAHATLTDLGRWEGRRGPELHGATLAIVGYGSIGQATASRAEAMGMRVGIVTRTPDSYADRPHGRAFAYRFEEIEKALVQADYVLMTAPLTATTYAMFDARRLATMKRGSHLVCITRAPVIEQAALFEALRSGHLGGVAMDCWWHEEEDGTGRDGYPADLPFHQFNMLMTPHYSGTTFGTRQRALALVGDNIGRLMRGEALRNEVSHHDLKTMAGAA